MFMTIGNDEPEEMLDTLIDRQSFSTKIEDLVRTRPMPYMDAILKCTEDLGLEIEHAAKMLNRNIKDQLESEAEELNLLKESPGSRLPI